MNFRDICLELSNWLYSMALQTKDLRHRRYLVNQARALAEKEIVEMDIEIRNLTFTANRLAQEIVKKDAELLAKDTEIGRLTQILTTSFSPLASSEIKE